MPVTQHNIFFDLDGTLLPMDEERFTQVYFKGLTQATSSFSLDPKQVITALWNGVKKMVQNDGSKTNEDFFWESFIGELHISETDIGPLKEALIHFYENEFKETQSCTSANPLAKPLVDELHKQGKKIFLTTNPIFPFAAVKTRMAFVGLNPEDFDDITTYETSKSAKPNPRYYLECMEKWGVNADDVFMVGNDGKEDIAPTSSLGIENYLVTDCAMEAEDCKADHQGTFEDCYAFLLK